MRKKVLSMLLSASLICTMIPVSGTEQRAAAAEPTASGVEQSVKTADDTDKITAGGSFGGVQDEETGEVSEDTHQWTFAEASGVLTISGKGDMPSYTQDDFTKAPWYRLRKQVKKVVFTGDVTKVGDYAFYRDYLALETVDISGAKGLKAMGNYAFAGSNTESAPLKEVIGLSQLTTFGNNVFHYSKLTGEVSLPDVTDITSNYIFANTEITRVSMPKLTTISGNNLFYQCKELAAVDMPELTTINGSTTFGTCTAITEISLPKLTEINANSSFSNCSQLTKVSLPELVTIKSSVQHTLAGTGLVSVTLPKLETTGLYLFDNCQKLQDVSLPEVTTLGSSTFRGAFNLVEVHLPKLTQIYSFSGCISLVYIDLPEGLLQKNITSSCFSACDSLQRIYTHEVPKSNISINMMDIGYPPKEVSDSSLKEKQYLTSTVYVPSTSAQSKWSAYTTKSGEDKVVVVDDYSTLPKESRLRIQAKNYDAGQPVDPEVLENTSDGEVKFSYYEMFIDKNNTGDNKRMRKLDSRPTEPGTYYARAATEAVGDEYFPTTSNFSEFTIYGEMGDEENTWSYNNKTNTLTIKTAEVVSTDYASVSKMPWYDYRNDITEVKLAEGVKLKKVGSYALAYLSKATEISIGDTLESVSPYAFFYSSAWDRSEPLTITQSIGNDAFEGCAKLAAPIHFADGVTEIPASAFRGCSNVPEIQIPDTITSFGGSCFENCKKLTEITIPKGVTEIPENFYYGTGVSEVVIPDQITSIGNSAFRGLNISSLTLPEGLKSLGTSVFYDCKNLETIELPASLTTLSPGVFQRATGLKRVFIPKTVTKIEGSTTNNKGLFQYCTNLELVIFENTEYTEETLGKCGQVKNYSNTNKNDQSVKDHVIDQMFQNTNTTVQVICDGDTYTLLDSYAKSAFIDDDPEQGKYYSNWASQTTDGWTSYEILNSVSVIRQLLQSDIAEAEALQEADYDKELWAVLQTEIQTAKALPEIDLSSEKVNAYFTAQGNIKKAVRSFLAATYRKYSGLVQSDYYNWDISDDDALDAWYDFEDARDVAKDILEEASLLTVAEYAEYEAALRKAAEGLQPLPADQAVAELNTVLAEIQGSLKEADYTAESWKALQDVIKEAEQLKTSGTISQIEAMQGRLEEAVNTLIPASSTEAKAALDNVIKSIEALQEADYTAESWKALQDAVAEAKALPENALVSVIQAAQSKIEKAKTDLVKAGGSGTPKPGDPSGNETPKPGDPSGNETPKPGDPSGNETPKPGDPSGNETPKPGDPSGNETPKPGNPSGNVTPKPGDPSGNVTPKPDTPTGTVAQTVKVKKAALKKVVSKKKKTAVLQWKKMSGVTGYQLQLATDKKFKKNKKTITVKKAKTTKVTVKKLKSKKKYWIRIRAYKTVNKNKVYGSWSKVKTVKIK